MPVTHDPNQHRFVLPLPEGEAILDYHPRPDGAMDILSTVVPPAARGRGSGGELVHAALAHARAMGVQVIPSCWFVRTWVGHHPE